MSSPLYPLGMNSYNNRLPQGGYKSWKGTGVFSNPTGVTAGNIRPLTNNDPTNSAPQKFGLPRPIQHYRKGITVTSLDNSNDSRQVKSSTGGGSLVGQMIDIPGGFSIKENPPNETSNTEELDKDCKTCQGVGIISDWQPITDLTEKPEPETQSREYCCNQERNALRRARSSNTKLKKNYYTNTANYLYNRCQTFEQKQFNYLSTGNATAKPGAPLSQNNTYNANCNPNLEIQFTESQLPDGITLTPSNPLGCERVQYHPNNYKYAQQGAVSSSDRMLRLNVETIDTNRANIIKNRENLTKSKYFPNASGSSSSNVYDECCHIAARALVRQGTFILDITYNENGAFFRGTNQRALSYSSTDDAPIPVIQNDFISVSATYQTIGLNPKKVRMTVNFDLFTNETASLLTIGLSFADYVDNYYNLYTSILEIIQFGGMSLYGGGSQFAGLTPQILISAPDQPRIIPGTSALNCFMDCPNFNSPAIINWNIANIINLQGIFAYATLFNQPIGGWDTSNVTNMSYMFYGASAFNQDISMLDTSAVEDMSHMFEDATIFNNGEPGIQTISGADASSNYIDSTRILSCPNGGLFLTELSLNDGIVISTSNGVVYSSQIQPPIVSDVSLVLLTAYGGNLTAGSIISIQKIPTSMVGNAPLSFNTGNVQNMKKMFQYALSFNQYIGDWDTHSVTEMSSMFVFASSFNNGQISGSSTESLNSWNTGSVTLMNNMFQNASAFNQPIDNWDTHSVTNMEFMFKITQFNQPLMRNGDKWNTGSVENISYMFQQTSAFNQDISSWNTSSVTNMSYMFYKALAFNNGDSGNNGLKPLNSWDTQSVTNTQSMFYNVTTFNQEVTMWTVTNVTTMTNMFTLASKFNNGDIGNNSLKPLTWKAPMCTSFSGMFLGAVSFNQAIPILVDTSGIILDASGNGVNLTSMLSSALTFNQNLNTWNVSKVSNMSAVFNTASVFNNGGAFGTNGLPLNWITDNVNTMSQMFVNAIAFNQPIDTNGPYWNTGNVTIMLQMFARGGGGMSFNQPIGNWDTGNVTIMDSMFYGASVFNQNISLWKTGNVTTMFRMFGSATSFNQTINTDASGSWNVSKVSIMSAVFSNALAFNNGGVALNWYAPSCTNFSSMFLNAPAFNQPISTLVDTSGITLGTIVTLGQMFQNAQQFNQNLNTWNVSRVTAMNSMFQRTAGSTSFNNGRPLGTNDTSLNWYAPNCNSFSLMFSGSAVFNQPIPSLVDTSGIALPTGCNLSQMFQNTIFNQNLNGWNVSRVTTMILTFSGGIFNNGDISGNSSQQLDWYAPNCTSFSSIFNAVSAFNQPIPFLVDTSGIALPTGCSLNAMFQNATRFNQNLNTWNVSRATSISLTFSSATAFNNGRLVGVNDTSLNWYAPNCTTFASMFLTANSFNQPIPSLVDTSGISLPTGCNLNAMFQNANLFNQNLNSWNVSRVTNMSLMFNGATIFNNGQTGTIDISGNLNTSSALYTNSSRLLTCTGGNFTTLTSADVLIITTTALVYSSQIQTTPVSDVSLVLLTAYGADILSGITSIKKQVPGTADLSWNTQLVTTTANMFQNATYFNQKLPWNMRLNRNVTSMFAATTSSPSTPQRFINLFNNGQILTGTSQLLYPGGGVNIWDFSGVPLVSISGGSGGGWRLNSRLIISGGNGVTANPALT